MSHRQTDGQTGRQNPSGYYSVLHCEQCERAVKIEANVVVAERAGHVTV